MVETLMERSWMILICQCKWLFKVYGLNFVTSVYKHWQFFRQICFEILHYGIFCLYLYNSFFVIWKMVFLFRMDEGRQPLSRKLPIPSSKINPYRMIIILRLAILGLFFHYRLLHPVRDAYGLWLTSVICEIWFAVSWILDQFPKWYPIERETYLDRLSLRFVAVPTAYYVWCVYMIIWHEFRFPPSCLFFLHAILNMMPLSLLILPLCIGMRKKGNHQN